MKKILMLVLGLFSIVCFGQSDIEIQPIYVANGFTSSPNYRQNHVKWSFDVINNGTTEAGVVQYTIYLSRDNDIDPNDIIVHTGSIGDDNLNSPSSGLDANTTIQVPSYLVTQEDFFIPWNYEANEDYFFIFEIEQDVNGGETNVANNKAVLPYHLSLKDNLQISHVDHTVELGSKTPLFLVHGWQPNGYNAEGNINIWNNFLHYLSIPSNQDLSQYFKLYFVRYNSNVVPVNDLGHELRLDIDEWFGDEYTGNINIVAHSMGGLVSRSFMNRELNGTKWGNRVNKLITLGTPHHGSHMANGEIRVNPVAILYPQVIPFVSLPGTLDISESLDAILNGYYNQINSSSFPDSQSYNRWDLRWDNFDTFFDYTNDQEEINEWLNSSLMNGNSEFDNKIIAYVGEIYNERSILTDISVQTLEYYYLGEQFLSNLDNINDGIVPKKSAEFKDHEIDKKRIMYDYYHDELAKGRFDYINQNGTDSALFGLIKADLLGNQANSYIDSNYSNFEYPDTVLSDVTSFQIVISNTGDLDLTISSIQLLGIDNTQFSFNFPTVPFVISSNDNQIFTVDFSPTSIGDKTVTFRVNNSSINNPQLDIQLSGLGVETAETDYNTNTEPVYDFGDVYIYGASELVTLTVSNSSSASYTVANLEITGLDASLFTVLQQPTLPKVFNPGDSETIIISFDPESTGEKEAVIEASFENNSIIDTAILKGNGVNTISNPNAPKLTDYEYWFNDDYASKLTFSLDGVNSTESLSFLTNSININNGLNVLHFRIKDSDGSWSSVSSDYVYIQNATNDGLENKITSYEYWFNNNYANKVTGNGSGTNPLVLSIDANISALENGLHQFHIRFKDEKGQWSSIVSEFIYNNFSDATGGNKIVEYRYWFNDDFDNRITNTIEPEVSYIFIEDINISGLTNNSTNYIHFQFKDINGSWSSILTEEFIFETLSLSNENIEKLNLYPNPTNSIIYIANQDINGELKVYDNLGKLILDFKTIPNEIDISNFESGLYLFYVKSEDDKIYQEKVVKY